MQQLPPRPVVGVGAGFNLFKPNTWFASRAISVAPANKESQASSVPRDSIYGMIDEGMRASPKDLVVGNVRFAVGVPFQILYSPSTGQVWAQQGNRTFRFVNQAEPGVHVPKQNDVASAPLWLSYRHPNGQQAYVITGQYNGQPVYFHLNTGWPVGFHWAYFNGGNGAPDPHANPQAALGLSAGLV